MAVDDEVIDPVTRQTYVVIWDGRVRPDGSQLLGQYGYATESRGSSRADVQVSSKAQGRYRSNGPVYRGRMEVEG